MYTNTPKLDEMRFGHSVLVEEAVRLRAVGCQIVHVLCVMDLALSTEIEL